jgi:streptomycin 3"-adenylyltransferase
VRSGAPTPDFELNLNTGAATPLHVDRDVREVAGHWFSIDRSVLAQAGIALRGPPAHEVFTPIPRRALAPVLVDSVRWYRRAGGEPGDAVLNACRALRFATEGRWSSKPEAGRWAVQRGQAPSDLVVSACAARTRPASLEPREVARFLETVESRLAGAAARR